MKRRKDKQVSSKYHDGERIPLSAEVDNQIIDSIEYSDEQALLCGLKVKDHRKNRNCFI